MKENIVRITAYDTKKTYEFPVKKIEDAPPDLWEIDMKIARVDHYGNADFRYSTCAIKRIHIEIGTLEAYGLTGCTENKKSKDIESSKTPEDLILELLELVGVYPVE